jgi:hypothetical protein
MKLRITIMVLLLASSLGLSSCANSRVGGSGSSNGTGVGNTENDVAFNPTTSSDLQIYNYKALRQRFINTFGLSASSDTIVALDAKQNAFKGIKYNATFAKEFAAVVAVACGEIPDSVAFPDGKSITHIWKLLNETEPTDDVKEIESKILADTAAETADVTTYGLCFAAFTSPPSVFINYTHAKSIL